MNTTAQRYDEPSLLENLWDTLKDFTPYLIPLGIFILAALVYANTSSGWIFYSWDDNKYITENPLIQHGLGPSAIWDIFSQRYFAAYLPMTLLSYAVEYTAWGLNATGYHIVNIVLHGLNGVLVYLFIKKLQPSQAVALIATLLFVVHPLQVENVAWISQRKSLLSLFFFLLGCITHINAGKEEKKPFLLVLGWLWFLLSILAKPTAVLAPVLFLYYDYYWTDIPLPKVILRNIPYFIIGIVGGIVMYKAHKAYGGIKEAPGDGLLSSLGIMVWAFWGYASSLVAPLNLNPLYIYNVDDVTIGNLHIWLGIAVLIGMALFALFQPLGKPLSRFAVLWVVVMIIPVSNIVPIAIQRADRYMYYPSILIFTLVGIAFVKAWERVPGEGRYVLAGVLGAFLMGFIVLTIQQNQIWHNEDTLWADNLKDYPSSETGLLNRGVHFFRQKDFDSASALFLKLLQYFPNHYKGNRFMGIIRYSQQDYQEAAFYFSKAVQIRPNDSNNPDNNDVQDELAKSLIQVGKQAMNDGDYQKAIDNFGQAARYDPAASGGAMIELGVLFFDQGKYDQALQVYEATQQVIPNEPVLYNNIGFTYHTQGDDQAALAAFQKAVELDDQYIRAWTNLGDAALQTGNYSLASSSYDKSLSLGGVLDAESSSDYCLALAELNTESEKALAYCQNALNLEPDNGLYLGRTAHALLIFGHPEEALPFAERATQTAPNLALGFRALGDANAQVGNVDAARAAYNRALEINPNNKGAKEGLAALDGQ